MDILERISLLIESKGLNQNTFSKSIGISQSTIATYYAKKRFPKYETLHAILSKYSDISAEWLMRGEGSMYVTDRLPEIRGDETESEQNLHVLLAQTRAKLQESEQENMRLLGQLSFMEEYNIKVAGKLSRVEKELEILRGSNNKKDIG